MNYYAHTVEDRDGKRYFAFTVRFIHSLPMPLGSESNSVQRPFVRCAVEARWRYLAATEALVFCAWATLLSIPATQGAYLKPQTRNNSRHPAVKPVLNLTI